MLFTLIIWVFTALSLLLALCFYLLFLWHYIPNSDGGLSGYCERKINSRLTSIVSAKVNKALEDEERKRLKQAQKAAKKGEAPTIGRQATIPTLFDPKDDPENPDKLPGMPMLHRNDTMATLPVYSSRPGTPGSSQQPTVPSFELDDMEQKRPFPLRTDTSSSYASNAPLIGAAAEMGYGRSNSPAPSLPPLDTNGFPFPQRSMTANSNGSQLQNGTPQSARSGPFGPPSRQPTQDSYQSGYGGPPSRQGTQDGYSSDPRGPLSRQNTMDGYTASPTSYDEYGRNSPRPQVTSPNSFSRPLPRPVDELSGRSASGAASVGRRTPFTETGPGGRSSPAPSSQMSSGARLDSGRVSSGSESGPQQSRGLNDERSSNGSAGGYAAYNPTMRSASAGIPGPAPSLQPQQPRPYRNMTEPVPRPNRRPTGDYPGSNQLPRQGTPQSSSSLYSDQYPSRQATPQGQRNGYGDQYNAYSGPGSQQRGGGPGNYNGRQGPPPSQDGYRR
jgi:Fungal potassium channel